MRYRFWEVGGGGDLRRPDTYHLPGPTPTTYPARHLPPTPPPDPNERQRPGVKKNFRVKKVKKKLPPAVKNQKKKNPKKKTCGGKKAPYLTLKKLKKKSCRWRHGVSSVAPSYIRGTFGSPDNQTTPRAANQPQPMEKKVK